ncbi:MAG: DNA alkylation repair protein [Paracoccaceae bacterium]
MPEPFKNIFSADMVRGLGGHLARVSDQFDRAAFEEQALCGLDQLELKARSEQFSQAIEAAMSGSFEDTVAAMIAALHPNSEAEGVNTGVDEHGVAGFAVMTFTSFVSRNGLDKPDFSLDTLCEMTKRFSSEFDVRPFYRDHAELTLAKSHEWACSGNVHVRRLASEGCRPRLPWGIRLHNFVADPSPVLPVLQTLRDDPSEYVRRSVANNLNDIAKDHADLEAEIAVDWLAGANGARKRLVKHACRSLIKDGHSGALAAFGFGAPDLAECSLTIGSDKVTVGDTIKMTLKITAKGRPQKLLVDYVLHFMRANGRLSA